MQDTAVLTSGWVSNATRDVVVRVHASHSLDAIVFSGGVQVRSNHDRLIRLSREDESQRDNPLKLKTTAAWVTSGMACMRYVVVHC